MFTRLFYTLKPIIRWETARTIGTSNASVSTAIPALCAVRPMSGGAFASQPM